MVTLKLLDRRSVSDSNGPVTGHITQRRRLAFLAILGASPRATDTAIGSSRSSLGSTPGRAASASLYVARRALWRDEAIVTEGD
jgi:hypothetical protein